MISHLGETIKEKTDAENRKVELQLEFWDTITKPNLIVNEPKVLERYSFNKIFFISNTPIVRRESYKPLEELYQNVLLIKNKKLEIRGHINWPSYYGKLENDSIMRELSLKRAETVFEYLKAKGVNMQNITCRGMHNTEMIYPDPKSPRELEQNMRVEIVVVE